MAKSNLFDSAVVINDKNKLEKYGDYYFHVMMTKSKNNIDLQQFQDRKIQINGLEPYLSIIKNNEIIKTYNFRINNRDSNTIKIHVPYPNTNTNIDKLVINDNNCSNYINTYNSTTGLHTIIKPHVSDMQIVRTWDSLNIFILCDIFSFYSYSATNLNYNDYCKTFRGDQTTGYYHRSIICQRHEIENGGENINITPSRAVSFPLVDTGGDVKFGIDTPNNSKLVNGQIPPTKFLYYNKNSIIDFHSGTKIFDGVTYLYCTFSTINKNITTYCMDISHGTLFNKEWTYRTFEAWKKVSYFDYNFYQSTMFNIYTHYVDTTHFYCGFSFWNNASSNIEYYKLRCNRCGFDTNINWATPIVMDYGKGLITFFSTDNEENHINFLYDNSKLIRKKGTNKNNDTINDKGYSTLCKITEEDLQWKYKFSTNSKFDKIIRVGSIDSFSKTEISRRFGNENIITLYKDLPLTISVNKTSNATYETDIYNFYANINNKPVKSNYITIDANGFKTVSKYSNTINSNFLSSGNYFISWDQI